VSVYPYNNASTPIMLWHLNMLLKESVDMENCLDMVLFQEEEKQPDG